MSYDLEELPNLDSGSETQSPDFVELYSNLYHPQDFIDLGINPLDPTYAKPGSDDKVMMLAARYAAGLPLWHDSDCYDHGPGVVVEDE